MKQVSEAEFQRQVTQLAKMLGHLVYHTHDSRKSAAGFPDMVIVKPGRRVIFAELKSATGKTSPEQDEWLEALKASGERVYLWRPEDLQEIGRILGE